MNDRTLIPDTREHTARGTRRYIPDRPEFARIARLACLCIAIFDGAHLVYRSNHAPTWFDVPFLLVRNFRVDPNYQELDVESHLAAELGLDC